MTSISGPIHATDTDIADTLISVPIYRLADISVDSYSAQFHYPSSSSLHSENCSILNHVHFFSSSYFPATSTSTQDHHHSSTSALSIFNLSSTLYTTLLSTIWLKRTQLTYLHLPKHGSTHLLPLHNFQ